MEFKDVLKKLMKRDKVTPSEVCKGAQIAKSTLHGLLNGADPTWKTVKKLAKFFNVSISYMETGEEVSDFPLSELIKIDVHQATYEVTVKRVINKRNGD